MKDYPFIATNKDSATGQVLCFGTGLDGKTWSIISKLPIVSRGAQVDAEKTAKLLNDHYINTGESLEDYVTRRIAAVFVDVAEQVGDSDMGMTSDETAGIPMELFRAQIAMIAAWRDYLAKGE